MNWSKELSRTAVKIVLGILLGGTAGYLYYLFYGCNGTCTITSSPLNSSLYGGLMGAILANSLSGRNKKE